MSQLTLILKREKSQTESKLSFQAGESLLLLCQKAGIELAVPCGGKGICGKCKVRFLSGAPMPNPSERRHIPAQELRDGYRLACMAKLTENCEILLPEIRNVNAVGTGIDVSWAETEIADVMDDCTNSCRNNCVNGCTDKSDKGSVNYFVTADIGTTTVVMEKRRIADGRVTAVYRAVNMQKKYGADILSRMEASVSGKREELSNLIREQLIGGLHNLNNSSDEIPKDTNGLLTKPETKTEIKSDTDIAFMIIAANTSMIHLLMGYDVSALCKAPFLPQTLDEIETEIDGIKTYIMPGISAFVGADLTAGMYAADYLKQQLYHVTNELQCKDKKESENEKEIGEENRNGNENKNINKNTNYINLLIDLGTNAEMILFDDKRAVCTSAAAGCAFDSIADAGVYGADVIAILARLLKNGDIDNHGTLREELFDSGVLIKTETWNPDADQMSSDTAHMVNITQEQIRQMQLAKAAVRCGIDYLTEAFGCRIEDISQVYLAGGFGYYLDVDAAVTVGLLPKVCRNITLSCGNTALAGAAVYADKKLSGVLQQHMADRTYTAINLAEQPDFSQRYISYLDMEV